MSSQNFKRGPTRPNNWSGTVIVTGRDARNLDEALYELARHQASSQVKRKVPITLPAVGAWWPPEEEQSRS